MTALERGDQQSADAAARRALDLIDATVGVWTLGSGTDLSEDKPGNPPQITAWRIEREQRVLSGDYRGLVVSPGIVYGRGQDIIAKALLSARTEDGRILPVGDGSQHWTTIHADDLAALYVTVLEKSPAHEQYAGVSGVTPTVREIAEAAGAGVVVQTREETVARLGEAFAEALLLDQQASGAKGSGVGMDTGSGGCR